MKAMVRTNLPSSAESVWQALLKRDIFLHVTRGMLGFMGSDQWPESFHEGLELETRLFFFHLVPGWKHKLRIIRVDNESFELKSEEGGGMVQKWNHDISVIKRTESSCQYTDEIDIDAGLFTLVIWLYAHVFYRYRQARWRRMASSL
jgi:hypothetical protein